VGDFVTVYAPVRLFPGPAYLAPFAPGAEIDANPEAARAAIVWPDLRITLTGMRHEAMAAHLRGLQAYVRAHSGREALAIRVLSSLSVYRLAIEPAFDNGHRAFDFVAGLTRSTEGLCLFGGELYDGDGHPLLMDPAGGLVAPSADRVAQRALVLVALAMRGLLDQNANTSQERHADVLRARLITWLETWPELAGEAEPAELMLLGTPIGKGREQTMAEAIWRAEGATVLLWALGAREQLVHDVQQHPYEMAHDCGVLDEKRPVLLENPRLRPEAELQRQRRRLLAIHWRLVEQTLRPGPVAFLTLPDCGFSGAVDLAGIAVADGDLAIGGHPVSSADPMRVAIAAAIAGERHQAANWLVGVHPTYSRVVTPT
jgi:hypothetical protein